MKIERRINNVNYSLIISLVLLKFGMNILGIICLVVDTIICAKNIRSKGIFNILILIINVVILGFFLFSIFTYTKKVKDSIDEVKYCQSIEKIEGNAYHKAMSYGAEKYLDGTQPTNNEYNITLKELGYTENDYYYYGCNCSGYVNLKYDNDNISDNIIIANVYIKCDDYITPGYNEIYDK